MRTVGDCVMEARVVLQDTVEPFRHPDADLLRFVNSFVSEARRMRPDLFVGSLLVPSPPVVALTEPFPITELYYVAAVNYLAGRAELSDDQFNTDGRANALIASLKAQMGTATA